jgi:two-component system response regulator AtoC
METTLTIRTGDDGASGTGFVYGESSAISMVNGMLAEIARTDIPVLIVGESGTGKEVYARLIHRLSGAVGAQPRKIDCRLLDTGRIVSEFHEVFQEAGEPKGFGSVFLDGIDELDLAAQRVLLSVLSEGEWSQQPKGFRPRLISASTKNMEAEVESGRFRRELYFRINGACLRLPALRERREDIADLVGYFLDKYAGLGKKSPTVDAVSLDSLREYHWPGNIRELENLTRKIVAVGNVEAALRDLRAVRIPATKTDEKATTSSLKVAAKAASREREKELILDALQRTRWNRKRAAQDLQISYKSLLYKIKQLEMPEALMRERGGK